MRGIFNQKYFFFFTNFYQWWYFFRNYSTYMNNTYSFSFFCNFLLDFFNIYFWWIYFIVTKYLLSIRVKLFVLSQGKNVGGPKMVKFAQNREVFHLSKWPSCDLVAMEEERLFPSQSIRWQLLKKRTGSDIGGKVFWTNNGAGSIHCWKPHIDPQLKMPAVLSFDTYTLALAERSAPLWSTPSSLPTETPSWSPASCCRPGRARSGSAPGQCPDSAEKIW